MCEQREGGREREQEQEPYVYCTNNDVVSERKRNSNSLFDLKQVLISTYQHTQTVHRNNVHINMEMHMEMHSQSHKTNSYVQRKTTLSFVDSGREMREEGPLGRHAIHTTHLTRLPLAWAQGGRVGVTKGRAAAGGRTE